jgi:hypothetical protein
MTGFASFSLTPHDQLERNLWLGQVRASSTARGRKKYGNERFEGP